MKVFAFSFFFFCTIHCIAGGIPGGVTMVNPTDSDSIRVGRLYADKLAELTGYPVTLLEVLSVTRQIVAGVLTKVTVKVRVGNTINICYGKIFEQPWLQRREFTESMCENEKLSMTHSKRKRSADVYPNVFFDTLLKSDNNHYSSDEEFEKELNVLRKNLENMQDIYNSPGIAPFGLPMYRSEDLAEEDTKNQEDST